MTVAAIDAEVARTAEHLSFEIEVFAQFADGRHITDAEYVSRRIDLPPPMVIRTIDESGEAGLSESLQLRIDDLERHVMEVVDQTVPGGRWGGLTRALREHGVAARAAELVAFPFELELDETARSLIAQPRSYHVAPVTP